jgi:hypothetical protein
MAGALVVGAGLTGLNSVIGDLPWIAAGVPTAATAVPVL